MSRIQLVEATRSIVVTAMPQVIGRSPELAATQAEVLAAADSDAAVLLTGESGTGKELLATALHARSARRDRPLVAVNCAAIPDDLFEAEVFGHERGAFSGAISRRDGRFRLADGGTILLDEIDALPLSSQAKLLRVLDGRGFQPLGADVTLFPDVRVVCTSNWSLRARVAAGQFREDLLYRINVIEIAVPSLRDRDGDLTPLVEHFVHKHGGDATTALTERAWAALRAHRWPGNVRELEHAIQRALVMARGAPLDLAHLPPILRAPDAAPTLRPLADATRAFETDYLRRALVEAGGNKTHAARLLGISRKNLWERLKSTEEPHANAHTPDPARRG